MRITVLDCTILYTALHFTTICCVMLHDTPCNTLADIVPILYVGKECDFCCFSILQSSLSCIHSQAARNPNP